MNGDGTVTAKLQNPVVSEATLKRILSMKVSGSTDKDIVGSLRLETVPPGNTVHNWISGYFDFTQLFIHVVRDSIILKVKRKPSQ